MKAKNLRSMAIWMYVSALTLAGCSPPEVVPESNPYISFFTIKDVTKYSAILSAVVIPNGDNVTVSFQLAPKDSDDWITYTLEEKISGYEGVNREYLFNNLIMDSSYKYRVIANETTSETRYFRTKDASYLVDPPKVVSLSVEEKINSAKVKAVFIPSPDDSVSLVFNYRIEGESEWKEISWPEKFLGDTQVEVTCDLSDLQAASKYEVYLDVFNIAGKRGASVTFNTCAVADYDGNLYHAVTIGDQTWLQENFRGKHFANGDPIPRVEMAHIWINTSTPAYCYYDNDPSMGDTYGALYNCYATMDPRGLIPGYRAPTRKEFSNLSNHYGDQSTSPRFLLDYKIWGMMPNENCFMARPNGMRDWETGSFFDFGEIASFWNSNDDGMNTIIMIERSAILLGRVYNYKTGAGIRLIKQ